MGLFKHRKSETDMGKMMDQFSNSIFPKGPKDINAGTNELLFILDNRVDFENAKSIFLKSVSISRLSDKFDEERLRNHLQGYCIQHFNDKQIEQFYEYLNALKSAMLNQRRTPSEVKRQGNEYEW
jgi:hypothetical protein